MTCFQKIGGYSPLSRQAGTPEGENQNGQTMNGFALQENTDCAVSVHNGTRPVVERDRVSNGKKRAVSLEQERALNGSRPVEREYLPHKNGRAVSSMQIALCIRSHLLRSGLREMALLAGVHVVLETASHQDLMQSLRGIFSPTAIVSISDDLDYLAPVTSHYRIPLVLVARTLLNGLELVNDARVQGLLVEDIADDTAMAPLLIEALDSVTNGHRYVVPVLKEPFADTPLTPREREILVMVARGYTISEMREMLNHSRRTLDTYRQRIANKIGRDLTSQTAREWIEQWWTSRHRASE